MPLAAVLDPLWAALLGLVEGLTEFLPVSSTGHLILVEHWLGATGEALKDYDVVIQSGAILAVLGLYRNRVGEMLSGLRTVSRRSAPVWGSDSPAGFRLLVNLLLAFIPAGAMAFLFQKKIKGLLFGPLPVAEALLVGGILMILLDLVWRKKRELGGFGIESLSPQGALVIGCCQCLALWPGTSRSLVTILGGLAVGMTPMAAAEFSFLLALPTLGMATIYTLAKNGTGMMSEIGPLALVIGFVMAMVSAAAAVKGFVAWLNRHGLIPFGVYRIILAGLLLWFLKN